MKRLTQHYLNNIWIVPSPRVAFYVESSKESAVGQSKIIISSYNFPIMRFWPFSVSLGHKVSPVGHSICYLVHGNDLLCLIEFIPKVRNPAGNAGTESLSMRRQHLHQIISCDLTSQRHFILTFDNLSLKSSRWGENTYVHKYMPNSVAGAAVHITLITIQAEIQSGCMCIHQIMLHNCIQIVFHHSRGCSREFELYYAVIGILRPIQTASLLLSNTRTISFYIPLMSCYVVWCIFIKLNVRILCHFIIDFYFKWEYCVCVCVFKRMRNRNE